MPRLDGSIVDHPDEDEPGQKSSAEIYELIRTTNSELCIALDGIFKEPMPRYNPLRATLGVIAAKVTLDWLGGGVV